MKTLRERFFAKVRREGECVVWTGKIDKDGYGQIKIAGHYRPAHRVSLYIKNGVFPKEMVLHSCDNRACVLPAHLREGTHEDNMQDMTERSRQNRGSKRPLAKLSELYIRDIRLRYENETAAEIAKDFGVRPEQVHAVAHGRTWKHIAQDVIHVRPKLKRYEVRGEMLTVQEIAEKYKLRKGTVQARVQRGDVGEDIARSVYVHTGKRK